MLLSGLVTDVVSRPVQIKKGPRAGTTSTAYSIIMDGKEIDCGFKCPTKKGEAFMVEITDIPNRWGKYELVKKAGSTSTESVDTRSVSSGPAESTMANSRNDYKTSRCGFPIPKSDHATSICRQNALTNAVNFHKYQLETGMITDINSVLQTAAAFAKWTTGQLEQEEAERLIKASVHEPNA